jgi:hypothetical protein
MKRETRQQLDSLRAEPLSFYQRVDAVVRLFETDDVGEILAALPPEFRRDFVAFGARAYAPEGPRLIVAGTPVPAACLQAFRAWLRSTEAARSERVRHSAVGLALGMKAAAARLASPVEAGRIPRAPKDLRFVETAADLGGPPRRSIGG